MTSTRSKGGKKPLTEEELELLQQQVQKQQERLLQESKAFEKAQEEFARKHEKLQKQEDMLAQEQLNAVKLKEMNSQLERELEQLQKELQAHGLRQTDTTSQDEAIQDFQNKLDSLQNEIMGIKQQARQEEAMTAPSIEKDNPISGISIREVIETIPKFDGYNIPLSQFSNACKRACNLIPRSYQQPFLKLVINKLYGRAHSAYIAMSNSIMYHASTKVPCETITGLMDILANTFGTNKTTDQYRGELSTVSLRPGEHILDYIDRTEELNQSVIDSSRRNGHTGFDPQELNDLTIRAFCNGLPRTYKLEMRPQEYLLPADAYTAAMKIFKDLEIEAQQFGHQTQEKTALAPYRSENRPQPNRNSGHYGNSGYKEHYQSGDLRKPQPTSILPKNPKFCSYCRRTGHTIDECFTKRRNEQGNGQGPVRTSAPHTDFDKSRSRQITPINKNKQKATIKKDEPRASTSKAP